jgi:DNA-binding GntR family transcriptional regulator
MGHENAPHKQLKDVVVEALRQMIARGELLPGAWLRQERLSETLKVSFTPIREALKQLEAEGLVEHVPYRGVRVVEFQIEDVLDIYTMRADLEAMAAGAAALRLDEAEREELHSLHARMAGFRGNETLQTVREDNRRFHQIIIEGSRRTYLIRTLTLIWSWFPTMLWSQFAQTATVSAPNREDADNAEHAAILAALDDHNPEAASRAMHYHIDMARQSLVEFLKNQDKSKNGLFGV